MISLFILTWIVAGFAFYMLPTIIALIRKKTNIVAIAVLNVLLGWSFIGWIIALVWSLTTDTPMQTLVIHNHNSHDIDGKSS